jgi:hypothetical protein
VILYLCCTFRWIIVIVISDNIMSDSDRRSTRRKRGPRRGSTNRALCSGLTGPVTRGNRGRIAQGFQANTEDQDGHEFGQSQSAKVQAKKSARGGTSGSFPIAFQLPMESSSIAAEGIVISTIDR